MINIEEMIENDTDAIINLEKMIFSDPWSHQSIEETFKQKQAFILVAKSYEQVIGYCIVYYALDQGEIARIAVHPQHQKAGVGCQLFTEVFKQCLTCGIEQLFLEVRASNKAAISLYQKVGFATDGVRKNYYQDPLENAVQMSNRCVSSIFFGK